MFKYNDSCMKLAELNYKITAIDRINNMVYEYDLFADFIVKKSKLEKHFERSNLNEYDNLVERHSILQIFNSYTIKHIGYSKNNNHSYILMRNYDFIIVLWSPIIMHVNDFIKLKKIFDENICE